MSQRRGATDEQVRKLRAWRALPRGQRPRTIAGMAAMLGISEYVAKRAAYGMRAYATDTRRVSRGADQPWQSHTGRKVCRPEALSVASSTGTPEITGVAGSAETRYHERRADPHGETGNAGAMGRGPNFA
jgi:hypothetical protein